MEIRDNDYYVEYDEGSKTIKFGGNIRLQGVSEYEPIKNLLSEVGNALSAGDNLTMNFEELKFLNSAGITTLSMFVINMRKKATANIKVVGSKTVSWQEKSLTNFAKIWSDVQVTFN